jgi:hypothetical protein
MQTETEYSLHLADYSLLYNALHISILRSENISLHILLTLHTTIPSTLILNRECKEKD